MSNHTNRGVSCNVTTCRYHAGREQCVAPVIAVKCCDSSTSNAVHSSSETNCATFESR